jgi:hypothetical protein
VYMLLRHWASKEHFEYLYMSSHQQTNNDEEDLEHDTARGDGFKPSGTFLLAKRMYFTYSWLSLPKLSGVEVSTCEETRTASRPRPVSCNSGIMFSRDCATILHNEEDEKSARRRGNARGGTELPRPQMEFE